MIDPDAQEFSEVLAPALQGLINDILSDRGGGMGTGFIALVHYIDSDGTTLWSFVSADGQPITQSAGMRDVLDKIVEAQLEDAMFGGQ